MRWIGILIITAAAAFADEGTALDQSRVTISYGELKALLAAAQPKPEPEVAPVPVAILSASYDLAAEPGFVDFQPANGGEIILTKELGRGDAPSMHLFYQKPETTKKP